MWDGGTARQVGLVDQFGGLDDALAYAAKQAKLGDGKWHAEYLGADADPYAPLFRRLMSADDGEAGKAVGHDMFALFALREREQTARMIADLEGLLSVRGAQARCLECPVSGAALPKSAPGSSLLGKMTRLLFQ